MLSKVVSFLSSKSKRYRKFGSSDEDKNNAKSMESQDDEDHNSIYSLFWSHKNTLRKSRSDISITALRDCNYCTQGTQVSMKTSDTSRNVTSTLEKLDLNDDSDENNTNVIDYPLYNQFDYNSFCYGIKTQDITTKEMITQRPEILNFQGNKHSAQEIAPQWKKDCRMWLWKSHRHSKRQNEKQTVTVST